MRISAFSALAAALVLSASPAFAGNNKPTPTPTPAPTTPAPTATANPVLNANPTAIAAPIINASPTAVAGAQAGALSLSGAAVNSDIAVKTDIKNTSTNTNLLNAQGGAGGKGGDGGTGLGVGIGGGARVGDTVAGGATIGDVITGPSTSNARADGGTASSDNQVTVNNNDQYYYEAQKRIVSSAIAAPVIHTAPCTVGGSAAVQTGQIGISLGGGKANVNCEVNVRTGLIAGLEKQDGEDYLAAHDETYNAILTKRREREAKQIAALAETLRAEARLAKAPATARLAPGITIGMSSQPFSVSQAKGTMAPIPN